MTSRFETTGLAVNAYNPLITDQLFQQNITEYVTSLTFVLAANRWYDTATLTLRAPRLLLEEWYENGLFRHIVVSNSEGQTRWEGFVNELALAAGMFTATRGPLSEISNRLAMSFTPIITSTTPPVIGTQEWLTVTNDTDSQSLYGIWEKRINLGKCTRTNAEYVQATYLDNYAYPRSTSQLGGGELEITLGLKGYSHMLDAYIYRVIDGGDVALSTMLAEIIAADPNGLISTSTKRIATNTLSMPDWSQDEQTAWSLILNMVEQGDASGNRYLFQVRENRVPWYYAIPDIDDISYIQKAYGASLQVTSLASRPVDPWDVEPGKWLLIPDMLPGRDLLGQDPRKVFLETVTFTAPHNLQWQGGKTDRLNQRLAQLGVSGLGV